MFDVHTDRWIVVRNNPRYSISNTGKVWDNKLGRELAQGINRSGYRDVKIQTPDGRKTVRVHRLSALSFYDVPDDTLLEVNHNDGNKSNNHIANLEFTDRSGNMKHAVEHGLVKTPYQEVPVRCVETGETFRNMREAARAINVSDHKSIKRVLDNPQFAARGLHFVSI